MTCCRAPFREITTQTDREARFLCTSCGKQGPEDAFPDPPPPVEPAPAPLTWREKLAEFLVRLAERILT
jgi:hypothetical protein